MEQHYDNLGFLDSQIQDFLTMGRFYERFVQKVLINVFGAKCIHINDLPTDNITIDGQTHDRRGRKYTKEDLDRICHIDLLAKFSGDDRRTTMDVKGPRRLRRQDDDFNYNIEYIEFANIYGGTGWIRGKADYITFVTNKDIIFANREKLYDHSCGMIAGNTPIFVGNIVEKYENDYLHKLSRRKDRQDLLTIVETDEVRDVAKNGGIIMSFKNPIDWHEFERLAKLGERTAQRINANDITIEDYR